MSLWATSCPDSLQSSFVAMMPKSKAIQLILHLYFFLFSLIRLKLMSSLFTSLIFLTSLFGSLRGENCTPNNNGIIFNLIFQNIITN